MVSKQVEFKESTFSFRMNPKGGNSGNVQLRNQGCMTNPLGTEEVGTDTRVETIDVGVSRRNSYVNDIAASEIW